MECRRLSPDLGTAQSKILEEQRIPYPIQGEGRDFEPPPKGTPFVREFRRQYRLSGARHFTPFGFGQLTGRVQCHLAFAFFLPCSTASAPNTSHQAMHARRRITPPGFGIFYFYSTSARLLRTPMNAGLDGMKRPPNLILSDLAGAMINRAAPHESGRSGIRNPLLYPLSYGSKLVRYG
jgi:hypothetical protein